MGGVFSDRKFIDFLKKKKARASADWTFQNPTEN
jgi:hypothetical protein